MSPYLFTVIASLFLASAARAADVSTHSAAGCAFPDTNQSISYTATSGEDNDYASSVSTMSFTVYAISGASVTVDNRTGLMWVTNQTQAGMTGKHTWESALTSCTVTLNGMAYGGYTDWRLPNVRELMSIVDYGAAAAPMINAAAFPGTVSGYYWTSTTYVPSTANAWVVNFISGPLVYSSKTGSNDVRCVRAGP